MKAHLKNLIFLGFKPLEIIRHYYKAADILLVPSLWHEPFGRVILEGAINGCYIIGSDRGAIPELIDFLKCGSYIEPTTANFLDEIKNFENYYKEKKKKIEKIATLKLKKLNYHQKFVNLMEDLCAE